MNGQRILQWVPWLLASAVLACGLSLLYAPYASTVSSARSTTRLHFDEVETADQAKEVSQRIESLWIRMVELKGKGNSVLDAQLPKATEEQIQELEDQIGCRLPPDYRAFLKIYSGSLWHTAGLYPSPDDIEEILWSGVQNDFLGDFGKPWQILEFPADGSYLDVVPNLWHPALIAIIEDDGAGYVLRLDTGEILWWDHDGWSFQYVAASFEELLRKSVEKSVASGEPDWWMDWP